ncbi:MAG: hypothetical protein WD229_11225 [Pirellulales bacterium]
MNKAFVKEPDDTGTGHCPRCGSLGTPVGAETLAAQLAPDARQGLADAAFFCPFARCPVAYFDSFERAVEADRLAVPVYPKDPQAPICGCFGFTVEEIEQDIRDGGVERVRGLLARSKGAEADCTRRSPSGQCCIADVQRYYMKHKEGGGKKKEEGGRRKEE